MLGMIYGVLWDWCDPHTAWVNIGITPGHTGQSARLININLKRLGTLYILRKRLKSVKMREFLRADSLALSPKHARSRVHWPKFYIIKALYFIAPVSVQANLPVSQSVGESWGLIMQRWHVYLETFHLLTRIYTPPDTSDAWLHSLVWTQMRKSILEIWEKNCVHNFLVGTILGLASVAWKRWVCLCTRRRHWLWY